MDTNGDPPTHGASAHRGHRLQAPSRAPMRLAAARHASLARHTLDAVHDLNNLFTLVLGHLEFMREGIDEASPLRGSLDQIEDAAEKGVVLVRGLLPTSHGPADA